MNSENLMEEYLGKKIRKQTKKILKFDWDNILDDELEPETIHKFRVSIRRLRSILEEFINEINIDVDLIYELRYAFRLSGKIRDQDILLENIEKLYKEVLELENPIEHQDILENLILRFKEKIEKKQKKYINDFTDYINSKKFKKLTKELKKLEEDLEFKNFYISYIKESSLQNLILAKFYKLLSHSYWEETFYDIKAIHHLRRQIKRTRYYFELFKKFYKKDNSFKEIINHLKSLQEKSGELVDIHILKNELQKLEAKNLTHDITHDESISILMNILYQRLDEKESKIFYEWNELKQNFYKNETKNHKIIKEHMDISRVMYKNINPA